MNEKDIIFDNLVSTFKGIPVYTSDFIDENTAVLINKKTGAGKIIEYEVRIQHLEKENTELKLQLDKLDIDCNAFDELIKENAEYLKGMIADAKIIKEADNKIIELEKKLADIKTLDRREVLNAFMAEVVHEDCQQTKDIFTFEGGGLDNVVTAICKLAIKPITNDKIIEVLKKYAGEGESNNAMLYWVLEQGYCDTDDDKRIDSPQELFETIANEILEVNND